MARLKYNVNMVTKHVEFVLPDQQLVIDLSDLRVSETGDHIENIKIVRWVPYSRRATKFKMKKLLKKLMMQILDDSVKYANKTLSEKNSIAVNS